MNKCKGRTTVYSRVTGFYSPVQQWNIGKREEYDARVEYDINKSMNIPFTTKGKE
jgi:anaerobic ribonucleoside-triphosphate reductase